MQASFLEAICFYFQTIQTPWTLSALAFSASRWTSICCAGELCAVVAGHSLLCIFSGEAGRKNTWAGFTEGGSGFEQQSKVGITSQKRLLPRWHRSAKLVAVFLCVQVAACVLSCQKSTGVPCSAGSQSTALGTCSRDCNALDGGFPCRYFQSHFLPVGSGEPCRGPAQHFPLQLAACWLLTSSVSSGVQQEPSQLGKTFHLFIRSCQAVSEWANPPEHWKSACTVLPKAGMPSQPRAARISQGTPFVTVWWHRERTWFSVFNHSVSFVQPWSFCEGPGDFSYIYQ